jgi:predicted DNA-binding transcriptional regulator AlpA
MSSEHPDPVYISVEDAIHLSGLSRSLIYREMANGAFPTAQVGKRRLIVYAAFRRWLDDAQTTAKPLKPQPHPPPKPRPIPPATLDEMLADIETQHGVIFRVDHNTLDVIPVAGKAALIASLRRLRS